MSLTQWVHRINRATTIPPFLIAGLISSYAVFVIAAIAIPPLSRRGYDVPGVVLIVASLLVGGAVGYAIWNRSRLRSQRVQR